jgi:putative ABC transport system permease protein
MRAVAKAVRAAVLRRRLQSLIIGAVVLLSSATTVLALGLLVASQAPFDHAFARQAGAHAVASFDAAKVSGEALAATASRPGVTAAAGPFDTVSAQLTAGSRQYPSGLITGRATQGGSVDRLTIDSGQWLTGPGQIVLARQYAGGAFRIGGQVTVEVAGSPTLRVVGIADSITETAGAWVWPTESGVLHATGAPANRQMLYRFASAGTDTAIRTSLATATSTLPAGALTGSSSYLTNKLQAEGSTAPTVPFVVAFAILGLVMSVLIVANVVGGAVVSGYRTIGVFKTLGFTPRQVVTVYAGQVLAVGIPACLLGAVLGNLLALPLLDKTARAYDVSGSAGVPIWVDLLVVLGLPAVVGVAAIAPALRAGRFSAVQAISIGRAPRSGRGYRVRRALAATRLPRPISFGLGTPFARPGRTAVTVIAVLLGAATVVFGTGLSTSLNRVREAFSRESAVPIVVQIPGSGPTSGMVKAKPGAPSLEPVDPTVVRNAIGAQPGTAKVVGLSETEVSLVGSNKPVIVDGYDGDASWVGYPLISGRWYAGPDEAVAGSRMLRTTGIKVGDRITISTSSGQRQIHVVGEVFSNRSDSTLVMDSAGLAGLVTSTGPDQFEVGLKNGTDPHAYATALSTAVASPSVVPRVTADDSSNQTIAIMLGLIGLLTVLLAAVAALGVFNTVVLNTRERVHEIGVLKSIGMTPRQVRMMVVASMLVIGALGGAFAVPVGYELHHLVLPIMANAAGTGIPHGVMAVYGPLELIGLGAAGIVLAILGALVPAGWAARSRPSTALRAE